MLYKIHAIDNLKLRPVVQKLHPKKVQKLTRWCKKNDLELLKISSVTGEGMENLKRAVFEKLSSGMLKVRI